jgi:beta-lactamase superfamily II metal-dependent hydrolase
MIDICDGNMEEETEAAKMFAEALGLRPRGNFQMCKHPTNPIAYAERLGVSSIFRFILTHPEMDHIDGFDALADRFSVLNFWDSGARRKKPDFKGSLFLEDDWDRYVKVRDGNEPGVATGKRQAGDHFAFANKLTDGQSGGDGLYILAPDSQLVADANSDGDTNDSSYVVLYRSVGGRVLLPGDAHDATFDYVIKNYGKDVANCSFMLAPHHGRDSDRRYDFLDHIRPTVTLLGCAPSEHTDYDQWRRRGLEYITSNQAGNVVLEIVSDKIHVYVENEVFAKAKGGDPSVKNSQGFAYLYSITPTPE